MINRKLEEAAFKKIPQAQSLSQFPGLPTSDAVSVEAISSSFPNITLLSQGKDKVIEGLYGEEVESGQTSRVFNVKGFLSSVSYDHHRPSIMKVGKTQRLDIFNSIPIYRPMRLLTILTACSSQSNDCIKVQL